MSNNQISITALPLSLDLNIQDKIERVTNTSNEHTSRVRIVFKNGYELSVVRGQFTYGGERGLFEIAPINLEGNLDGSLLDEDDQGDDVLGYLTPERVNYYVEKIGNLK